MEFRYPTAVTETNLTALRYLTLQLRDPKSARVTFDSIINKLGNSVESYPEWHPILQIPKTNTKYSPFLKDLYKGIDHTVKFVRGFVTCPYQKSEADKLVDVVNKLPGLKAYHLNEPLYSDDSYPVVVEATDIVLEADGTIRTRDALVWCVKKLVEHAHGAEVAETWWNIRSDILGKPHGSRSSVFVNQYTGGHMRKILEALNNSGMYGEILERSLEMLSKQKRNKICDTLMRAALKEFDKKTQIFEFELHGEICQARIIDTWNDGSELSIKIDINENDLNVNGFYYQENDRLEYTDPRGKKKIAEKFL
ncbi:hypothetical protein HC725_16425 [Vibrio sp. S17_S38]|uniref:hypothetical protein n=1 Tax=Vibrio sp. S17_S38 TaxID=2720229 RepID=UPI001680D87D|nr:hypothetical protein [Vibrio sp. S17_S38]MBD1574835.1 hypothetical protein [Vibrio sp. S17_S38]